MRRDLAVERLEHGVAGGLSSAIAMKRQRGTSRTAARTARAPVRIVSSARTKWMVVASGLPRTSRPILGTDSASLSASRPNRLGTTRFASQPAVARQIPQSESYRR